MSYTVMRRSDYYGDRVFKLHHEYMNLSLIHKKYHSKISVICDLFTMKEVCFLNRGIEHIYSCIISDEDTGYIYSDHNDETRRPYWISEQNNPYYVDRYMYDNYREIEDQYYYWCGSSIDVLKISDFKGMII